LVKTSARSLRAGRSGAHLFGLAALLIPWLAVSAPPPQGPVGEGIYRLGLLAHGEPLIGQRDAGANVSGTAAACVTCHRRSGFGEVEGRISIPPIAGAYLFAPGKESTDDTVVPYIEGLSSKRKPYSEVTLAAAIRKGIGSDGRALNYLMPRYPLDTAAMASLIAYLKGLKTEASPGVTKTTLHFAVIVTPDADPKKRQAMLEVMEKFFTDKNAFLSNEVPRMVASHRLMYRVIRKWQLHVWELTGAPDTWAQQLRTRLEENPVLAAISGLGGKNWAPVHDFCERQGLPCLFPNVELPVVVPDEFYTVYFTKGLLLEGELLAKRLQDLPSAARPHRVVQVFRAEDSGASGADAFERLIGVAGPAVVDRRLDADAGPAEIGAAVADTNADDVLMLWLRPEDLAGLPDNVAAASNVYISGLLGGLENAPLAAAWRTNAHLLFPVDLPNGRKVRLTYPYRWFSIRQIPIVADQVQTDTYLACGILAETLSHMGEAYVRDYLVERVEVGLSRRIITGYYPRLGLAPGQRFASKGGYIVRFAEPTGTKVTPETDWVVP
jgi:hypothetical protein